MLVDISARRGVVVSRAKDLLRIMPTGRLRVVIITDVRPICVRHGTHEPKFTAG